jgi:hypothetical protein
MVEGVKQKFVITKTYGRKVTVNFQSYTFDSTLTTDVEVSSGAELLEASSKLFAQCKYLTEQDIETTFPQEPTGE